MSVSNNLVDSADYRCFISSDSAKHRHMVVQNTSRIRLLVVSNGIVAFSQTGIVSVPMVLFDMLFDGSAVSALLVVLSKVTW
jgi:hypothetical protein